MLLPRLPSQGADVTRGGSNYPLRGMYNHVFEGGTRVPAFVVGHGLNSGNFSGIFHV